MILALLLLAAPTGIATSVKPVTCVELPAVTGKELASAIEQEAARLDQNDYELVAVLPGTPAIACFRHRHSGPLPRGVR